MRPVRILFLDYTNGIGLGGGQRSLALLIRNLPPGRFRSIVACPPGEQLRAILPGSVRVEDLPLSERFTTASRFSGGLGGYLRSLAACRGAVARLRALIERHAIDIVHANNFKMHVLALAATVGRRTPVLWHVRDIFPDTRQNLMRAAARGARHVLSVSQAVANQFQGRSNVSVLYNAVELPLRLTPAQPDGPPVIGYAGRLDPGKGLDTLVSAFLETLNRHPGARLLIAGDGPARASLPQHPAIEVAGFQNDVSAVWRRMDVCVQPSTQPDSFPRAVIEAMSWSKPVIGARIGGIPEAIVDGETGWLFQPGNTAGLANCLDAALSDRVRARAMGEAGRNRCEDLFSVSAQIERLTNIYENTYALCHS